MSRAKSLLLRFVRQKSIIQQQSTSYLVSDFVKHVENVQRSEEFVLYFSQKAIELLIELDGGDEICERRRVRTDRVGVNDLQHRSDRLFYHSY